MMPGWFGSASPTRPQAQRVSNDRSGGILVCGIAAGALLLASAGGGRTAATSVLRLRCTNLASGASWPLVVDLDRGRVDSLSATITDRWISWHDPKQGFFDLERATGDLQLRNASSTGGYFLHFVCRPDQRVGP
jgi:hypothetical protein